MRKHTFISKSEIHIIRSFPSCHRQNIKLLERKSRAVRNVLISIGTRRFVSQIKPTSRPDIPWKHPFGILAAYSQRVISCCTWPSLRKIQPYRRILAEVEVAASLMCRISRGPCRSGRNCIRRTWRRNHGPHGLLCELCYTHDAPPAHERTAASKGSCNNQEEGNGRLSLRLRETCQLRAVADYEKSKRIDGILLLFISNNVRNFWMINLVEWQHFFTYSLH